MSAAEIHRYDPDDASPRDLTLASVDAETARAVKNLQGFREAERRAEARGDVDAVLPAIRAGIDALQAHLRSLGERRARWTA